MKEVGKAAIGNRQYKKAVGVEFDDDELQNVNGEGYRWRVRLFVFGFVELYMMESRRLVFFVFVFCQKKVLRLREVIC